LSIKNDPEWYVRAGTTGYAYKCNPGVVCTHEGNCNRYCGGDHYVYSDGVCLRCGQQVTSHLNNPEHL
jgi:hypothetical protein